MAFDVQHPLVRELADQLVEARFADRINRVLADLTDAEAENRTLRADNERLCARAETAELHRDRLQKALLALNDGDMSGMAEVVHLASRRNGTGLTVAPTIPTSRGAA